jgi:hypothetical protein
MHHIIAATSIVLLLAVSSAFAMQEDEAVVQARATNDIVTALMKYQATTAVITELNSRSSNDSGFSFDRLAWLLVPGAMVFDTFSLIGGLTAKPFTCGYLAVEKIREAIDDFLCTHSDSETQKLAISGYRKRLEQIQPFIKDKQLSPQDMIAIALACTAWDSQKVAPEHLVLANGEKLKQKLLLQQVESLSEKPIILYNHISLAASYINKNSVITALSFQEYMNYIVAEVTTENKTKIFGPLRDHLFDAATQVQIILKAIIGR